MCLPCLSIPLHCASTLCEKLPGVLHELHSLFVCQLVCHQGMTCMTRVTWIYHVQAGINYGPPGTKQLIYFVDDLNMPKLDPYETAMPISLIRQHLGWGHWFDRAKLTQKNINNTQ